MKLIPRDKRFIDFNVSRENAFSVECEAKKGFPPQRFIKYKPGWSGQVGRFMKRGITRFLGLEGTAYTCEIEQGETITLKQKKGKNPREITISNAIHVGSLADALKTIWGTRFYNQVPEAKRITLEEGKVNVIVGLEDVKTPEGFKEITEEAIKQEEDRLAAETWWQGKKQADKGTWLQYIFIAGFGFGVALALQILGVLRI